MDIGKKRPAIQVEPVEDPFRRPPSPDPAPRPAPAPEREPAKA